MIRRFRTRKLAGLATLAVAAVAGVSAYAFTASNTVPDRSAGAGSGAVTGYTITGYTTYTFSPDGTTIEGVQFDLDKAASDVQVALTDTGPTADTDWSDCGASGAASPFAVTCTFTTPIAVGQGNTLSMAAVSEGTVVIASS